MRTADVPRLIAAKDPTCLTGNPAPIDVRELAWVILDGRVVRIAEGTRNNVTIPLPAMLAVPIRAGWRSFSIAHSHPGGSLTVTDMDRDMTRKAVEAAALCGLILEDSYIVSPAGYALSMVESGDLEPLRETRTHAMMAASY